MIFLRVGLLALSVASIAEGRFGRESRGNCRDIQVVSHDSCGSLAQRCGISGNDFMKYNPKPNLCSTLQPGQWVCCSAGTLPDHSPKPNKDGSCASYTVGKGDTCSAIALTYSLTVDKINRYNKNTWGWIGCNPLQLGAVICLSTGTPPMPAAISNAICGPQKPGTKAPSKGTSLASLNPCPLNACCDKWGQCGTTDEFCQVTKSPTGAPGTSFCISNCGTSIVNNKNPPSQFKRVGFYESWNLQRPCLNMAVSQINTSAYTHVHFAFATITANTFDVDVSAVLGQFIAFTQLTGVKRILSFGGWSFSTSQDSYAIFRDSFTDANRITFAKNVIAFVQKYNLDGVDFDWEYPDAPDIPGIPPGKPSDGPDYLQFLKAVRAILPSGKTMSMAAPASYWYLRGFPISDMAPVLDYIVYMASLLLMCPAQDLTNTFPQTYDLHGQWDYQNKFADAGCPTGSCLRSHVNFTETLNALSMITKAGVPTNKLVVGVSSYGRSFKIAQAGCTGPQCKFTGPSSGARPGQCTQTAGVLANAEIQQILSQNPSAKSTYDSGSGSNIMTYNGTEWVAYMDDGLKAGREVYYAAENCGGFADWAIDLQSFQDATIPPVSYPPCTASISSLSALAATNNIPDYCMNTYLIQILSSQLDQSLHDYSDILSNDYDSKFNVYSTYIQSIAYQEVDAFTESNPDKYFTCQQESYVTCCNGCEDCVGGCDPSPTCVNGNRNVSTQCPTYIPSIGDGSNPPIIHWTWKDQASYWKDLFIAYGVVQDWVDVEDRVVWVDGGCSAPSPSCEIVWTGLPQAKTSFTVPNPKDSISAALNNYVGLQGLLDSAVAEVSASNFLLEANTADVVDAASLPVYMAASAVTAMQQVADEASKIEAAEKKEMILAFLTAFLLVVPIAGEAVDAAGLAAAGRIIQVAGEVGNGALSIYGVVQDPSSAIFALFGALISAKDWAKAAGIRRGLADSEISALGDGVSVPLSTIKSQEYECI